MTAFLSSSWVRAALVAGVFLLVGFAAIGGYRSGYEKAAAIGKAELETLKREHALAYADAVAKLSAKVQAETARALATENALSKAKEDHAKQETSLRSQIKRATSGSRHVFGADFVSVYNAAIGADRAELPRADRSPGPDGKAGAGVAPVAGILDGVSEADLLAHIVYYGGRCRNLESQVNAWINHAEGWQ